MNLNSFFLPNRVSLYLYIFCICCGIHAEAWWLITAENETRQIFRGSLKCYHPEMGSRRWFTVSRLRRGNWKLSWDQDTSVVSQEKTSPRQLKYKLPRDQDSISRPRDQNSISRSRDNPRTRLLIKFCLETVSLFQDNTRLFFPIVKIILMC